MLKMRLTRIGKKHSPAYRIVVTPKENPALGQYLDLVGTYNPIKEELSVNKELALEWLNKGVLPSDRVARLLKKSGVEHKSIVIKNFVGKPKSEPKAEKPTAAPIAEEVVETPAVEETAEEATPEESSTEEVTEPAVESTQEETAE
jgi:small subunit ribosomal protein S16